jgi:hypothetical protein
MAMPKVPLTESPVPLGCHMARRARAHISGYPALSAKAEFATVKRKHGRGALHVRE